MYVCMYDYWSYYYCMYVCYVLLLGLQATPSPPTNIVGVIASIVHLLVVWIAGMSL